MNASQTHHVVIVGGGFGGLYTAQALKKAPTKITLIDRRNFHLFQPLLYQVATGGLSPGDIASPLRAILKNQKNAAVLQAEVIDIMPAENKVILNDGEISYDSLILAAGAANHYYGLDEWQALSPGLKTIEDALDIRSRILEAFEAAERERNPVKRRPWLTFVVIGGRPTGVELAGAIAELAHSTLEGEFRYIDPTQVNIVLLEGHHDVLPPYPDKSSVNARKALEKLGVQVLTQTKAEEIGPDFLTYRTMDEPPKQIQTHTVLWAAGMGASPLAKILEARTGVQLDPTGRDYIDGKLALPGYPEIYVIGDMAHVPGLDGQPLAGIAPVAMQQGRYTANRIKARLTGRDPREFVYRDKGTLAVIGRNAAVAVFGRLQLSGFLAWITWIFIHLWYLIEYDNKMMVMLQWAWNYFTRKRGARLITGKYVPEPANELGRSYDPVDLEQPSQIFETRESSFQNISV